MYPPPGAYKLTYTYVRERTIRQLAIPFVLDLCDLASVFVIEDVDSTGDGRLLAKTLQDIASL